ncbi:hypothetical protein PENARI_c118G09639 [Penicillium arizonense]|uniref:Methyltransferase domain-containing protein n=1 Tax=Penicillium arizonense TaxID=1835702 RepID=A0A1F5L0I1_PENAI|nr:hypothetical protein PENARI_c131G04977 [Penicillium arizonense]XP_022482198.1 hypothetical protein PENARI_c126G01138 [Penicillium arizonense]XP_022482199.1 hypothetical protein PENARI_c125G03972 [Penicillium arizonense]XP_022482229.1 hypothetical protein PENARI_c118G09639 [Penicillium arizonense]OGE46704.1 hypothetical protein PENARI_c131G04977 [Penicillium arizonense]OGE46730.1 hypothetical protein PENARI_c126G01138 [Penicillium arizonense]OGE46731.1 hypothetical protein PENARI_c125G03972
MGAPDTYIFLRDKKESHRLNKQHQFIAKIIGGPINNTIPLDSLTAIADVGTGTGVWLEEVRQLMNETCPDIQRVYQGFDISDAQFPYFSENTRFEIHDILLPFPSNHINRYDLINMRLLVGAIKESDFAVAIQNLITMLKPGGYLQWTEFELNSHFQGNSAEFPAFKRLLRPFFDYLHMNEFSTSAPEAVNQYCKRSGLINVKKFERSVLDRPELQTELENWDLTAFAVMMPLVYERTGQAKDEITNQQMTSRMLSEFRDLFARGLKPGCTFGTVICQKPEIGPMNN